MQKTLVEDEEIFKGYRTLLLERGKASQDTDRNRPIPKRIMESIASQSSDKQGSDKSCDKSKPLPEKLLGSVTTSDINRNNPVPKNILGSSALESIEKKEAMPEGVYEQVVIKDADENKQSIEKTSSQSLTQENSRNKQIPKRILEAIKNASQKPLSKYFEIQRTRTLNKVEGVIGAASAKIANDVNANCIVSIERSNMGLMDTSDKESDDPNITSVKVVVFKKIENGYKKSEYHTRMKVQSSGSIIPIKELLMEGISKKYIQKGDRIVCVGDESVGMGYKGLIFIFDVDKVFFNMSTHRLTQNVSTEVLEAIINLALEIGNEGREGRKIGTAFVIGKRQDIMKYGKQIIINPFSNYPEEARLVSDPNMKETVKGFAQLDGVFMVDEKGVLLSAGTLINLSLDGVELPGMDGFGTRHRFSAAITKLTEAIAVVVSESGGVVRVFKDGKAVMKLP